MELLEQTVQQVLPLVRIIRRGYKTPLTVTLTDNATITATLDTIFTVPTSPNVATAYFWGHMADTATVSGKMLHRPLLKSGCRQGLPQQQRPM